MKKQPKEKKVKEPKKPKQSKKQKNAKEPKQPKNNKKVSNTRKKKKIKTIILKPDENIRKKLICNEIKENGENGRFIALRIVSTAFLIASFLSLAGNIAIKKLGLVVVGETITKNYSLILLVSVGIFIVGLILSSIISSMRKKYLVDVINDKVNEKITIDGEKLTYTYKCLGAPKKLVTNVKIDLLDIEDIQVNGDYVCIDAQYDTDNVYEYDSLTQLYEGGPVIGNYFKPSLVDSLEKMRDIAIEEYEYEHPYEEHHEEAYSEPQVETFDNEYSEDANEDLVSDVLDLGDPSVNDIEDNSLDSNNEEDFSYEQALPIQHAEVDEPIIIKETLTIPAMMQGKMYYLQKECTVKIDKSAILIEYPDENNNLVYYQFKKNDINSIELYDGVIRIKSQNKYVMDIKAKNEFIDDFEDYITKKQYI